jgi:hypothetical protein
VHPFKKSDLFGKILFTAEKKLPKKKDKSILSSVRLLTCVEKLPTMILTAYSLLETCVNIYLRNCIPIQVHTNLEEEKKLLQVLDI